MHRFEATLLGSESWLLDLRTLALWAGPQFPRLQNEDDVNNNTYHIELKALN